MTTLQFTQINNQKELIQNILPDPQYTAGQRELFVGGMCSTCWDKIFSEEESEDDSPEAMELSGDCPDLD